MCATKHETLFLISEFWAIFTKRYFSTSHDENHEASYWSRFLRIHCYSWRCLCEGGWGVCAHVNILGLCFNANGMMKKSAGSRRKRWRFQVKCLIQYQSMCCISPKVYHVTTSTTKIFFLAFSVETTRLALFGYCWISVVAFGMCGTNVHPKGW